MLKHYKYLHCNHDLYTEIEIDIDTELKLKLEILLCIFIYTLFFSLKTHIYFEISLL